MNKFIAVLLTFTIIISSICTNHFKALSEENCPLIKVTDSQIDFVAYLEYLNKRLSEKANLLGYRTEDTEITFKVNKKGVIREVYVAKSSKNRDYNDSAWTIVKELGPLPPLPVQCPDYLLFAANFSGDKSNTLNNSISIIGFGNNKVFEPLAYIKSVGRKLERQWYPAGDPNNRACVTFNLDEDGNAYDIKILKTGGAAADKAAIRAVEKATPFNPPPKGIDRLDLVIPMSDWYSDKSKGLFRRF